MFQSQQSSLENPMLLVSFVVSSHDGCEEVSKSEDNASPLLHQSRKTSSEIERKTLSASE